MHVTRVELENIKSYSGADYRFERGATAITGENGAGKTTILEAIAWSLFDTLDYNKEDFLKRGKKKGWVRVTFESGVDERQYVVYRDTGSGYYVFDPGLGIRIAEKKIDVAGVLRKLLGIEPGTDMKSLFRSAIGVAQGTYTAEFLMPANARKAAFDRLLRVEEYRDAAENLRGVVALVRDRIGQVNEQIARAEGELSRYSERLAEFKILERQATEFQTELDSLQVHILEYTKLVEQFDLTEADTVRLRSMIERLEVTKDAATRRLRDSVRERDAADKARARQVACESDYSRHVEAIESLKKLDSLRIERDRLLKDIATVEKKISMAESEMRQISELVDRSVNAQVDLQKLEGPIEEQQAAEKEREQLRERRANAISENERLKSIEADLERLRKSHVELSTRAKQAAGFADSVEKAEKLEKERNELSESLIVAETAINSLNHLNRQRANEVKEVNRLTIQVRATESEISTLREQAKFSVEVTLLAERDKELADRLAKLKAEIARDEKFHAEVRGGFCPILSQKCLNLGEGKSLEDYFTSSFTVNTAKVRELEGERAILTAELEKARESVKYSSKLEAALSQLETDRRQLKLRESELARIDSEISGLASTTPESLRDLKSKAKALEAELKRVRANAQKYAELQPLQERLIEIGDEGKQRRAEHDLASKVVSELETIQDAITNVEARLTKLDDPRARSLALNAETRALDKRRSSLVEVEKKLEVLRRQSSALLECMTPFVKLDEQIAEYSVLRDSTAKAHREYLESSAAAAMLPDREAATRSAEIESAVAANDLQAKTKEYDSAISNYDHNAHKSVKKSLATSLASSAVATSQLDSTVKSLTALREEISRLDIVRATMLDGLKSRGNLEKIRDTTEFIRDTLKAAGPIVTESYLFNISVEANQLFREISGEAGRTLRWTRDYEIVIEEDGYERPFANLSGGEQMAAALSIRLALLKQLSDIRMAFFDEPTTNMDAERRERLAQQIGQIRHFDQLFVISHDNTFEESVDQVLHVSTQSETVTSMEAA